MKNLYQYSAIIFISIILGSSLYILNNSVEAIEDENNGGYYVTLELYHYRGGELIDKRIIENDYILRNFVNMWLNILSGDRHTEARTDYKFRDITNTERTFPVSKVWFDENNAQIRLGTGANPVTVTNYKLQTEVLSQIIDDASIWVNVNQFNVTADTTIISDNSYSIKECGLSIEIADATTSRTTLICRDVFSAINVDNTDVIVIRYIFRFNL